VTCPTTSSFGTLKPCQTLQVMLLPTVSLENRTKKSENRLAASFQSTSTTRLFASVRSSLIKNVTIWAINAIGAPHIGERPEKELIASFVDRIAELTPQLVTFNGNTFDLVLRYRAMIHAVAAPGLTVRPYFNRYTEDALDLCDVLSSFAPHTKASLNELSRIMGLPGKPDSIDGTEVERYFLDGKIKEIADYCETDVVNTYRMWLRYELFRGKLSNIAFQASETNLSEFIRARSNAKPHLAELT
jgi:3'-5' exonuclease